VRDGRLVTLSALQINNGCKLYNDGAKLYSLDDSEIGF